MSPTLVIALAQLALGQAAASGSDQGTAPAAKMSGPTHGSAPAPKPGAHPAQPATKPGASHPASGISSGKHAAGAGGYQSATQAPAVPATQPRPPAACTGNCGRLPAGGAYFWSEGDSSIYIGDTTPVDPWDAPVDAAPVGPEVAPPAGAEPIPQPPPQAAAPVPDGCEQTTDTAIEDGELNKPIYRWVDAEGVVHFSDYELIPEASRAHAKKTSGEPIMVTKPHLECGPPPAAN